MISITLEALFKGIGYSLILYAFWLLFGNNFYQTYIKSGVKTYQKRKRIKRLRQLEKVDVIAEKRQSPVYKHLELLLNSVYKNKANVANFIMLSLIILFVTTLLLYMLINDLFLAILIGLVFGISPYLFMRYRLETIRLKTSQAFMNEFHVILQNYQSTKKNVYYTLMNTTKDLDDRHMKLQFRKLISSFQKERQDTDFKQQVHVFIFSINSTFAKRFGNLLIKAHLENTDIGNSLVTLNEDITNRKKDIEHEHTEKLQTIMIGFAPIIVLPLMVWFSYQVTGVINFWHYFMNPTSLTIFIITVLCSIASISLAFLMRRPKADI